MHGSDLEYDLDAFFLFTMSIFIFFLHLGFGMVEIAIAKKSTVIEVMLKNFLNLTLGILVYWTFGFMFAFGGDFNDNCKHCNGFIGVENPFLIGLPTSAFVFFFFEYTIATVAIGIVGNSVAERLHFPGYFVLAITMTGWVQPIIFHWVWSTEGWLSIFAPASKTWLNKAYLDFAGAGVIHLTGGCHALVGAIFTGHRHNYYKEDELNKYKNAHHFLPRFKYNRNSQKWEVNHNILHSPLAQSIGIWILWTAWYGFNNGSMIKLRGNTDVLGRTLICTALGAGAGGVVALFFGRIVSGEFDILDFCNGTLVGLVGNGAACAFVQPWAAVAIGAIAGVIYKCVCAVYIKLRIDDPCDAGPIHGSCGLWGAMAVGFFADPDFVTEVAEGVPGRGGGIFYGYGSTMLIQIVGTLCIMGWSFSWALLTFGTMKFLDRNKTDDAFFFIKNTTPPGKMIDPNASSNRLYDKSNSNLLKNDHFGDIHNEFRRSEIELDHMN